MRVVRKLTRVMKTQWNYNKPIAKLIRSPGRRPFNNKTRSYGSRSRSYPRSRLTYTHTFVFIRVLKVYIHVSCVYRPEFSLPGHRRVLMCACICVCKRINFSRAFMLSDWPNYGVSTVRPHLQDVSARRVCVWTRNTHSPTPWGTSEDGIPLRKYVWPRGSASTQVHLPTFLPAGGRLLQPAKFQNTLMASVHQGNRITQWSNT